MKSKRKTKSGKIPTCSTCTHETRSSFGCACNIGVTGRYYFQMGKSRCSQYQPKPPKDSEETK